MELEVDTRRWWLQKTVLVVLGYNKEEDGVKGVNGGA